MEEFDWNLPDKNDPMFIGKPSTLGVLDDLRFCKSDDWLVDTEVIESIVKERGMWSVYLVFASIHDGFQFVRKRINQFSNEHKARISAKLYQRSASKDARGYLKLKLDDFNICHY